MDIHELQAAEPEALKPIYPQLNFVYIDQFLDAWIQDISADQALGGPIPTESWGAWAHRILEDKESDVHTKIYLLAVLRYYESFPLATVDTLKELRDDLLALRADVAQASGDPSKLPERFRTFLQPAATLAATEQIAERGGLNLFDEVRALEKAGFTLTDIPTRDLSRVITTILKQPAFGVSPREARHFKDVRKKALDLLSAWGMEFHDDPSDDDPYQEHPLLKPRVSVETPRTRTEAPSMVPDLALGFAKGLARVLGDAILDITRRRDKNTD